MATSTVQQRRGQGATAQAAADAASPSDVSDLRTFPKRVGFLLEPSPFTHLSGYTNRFDSLTGYLLSQGVEVAAAVPQHMPLKDALWKHTTAHGDVALVPLVGGQRIWFWFGFIPYKSPTWRMHSMVARSVGAAFNELDVELVHSTAPGFSILGGIVWANFFDVPLVVSYHTHAIDYLEKYTAGSPFNLATLVAKFIGVRIVRFIISFADVALCPSPELAQHLVKDCGCRDGGRIQVWRKGVDAERFNPKFRSEELRTKLLGGKFKHLLLNVGRLAPEKNLEELKPILARLPEATIAIVGEGPAHDEVSLRATFADEVESGQVTFVGVVRGEALSQMFASADAFVMTSRSETLGFVVLESMSSGVPVVATRSGGVPSIIHHEEDSFLYPEGDTATAASLVERVLSDDALRRRLSTAARAEAERLSWAQSHSHVLREQYAEAVRAHEEDKKNAGLLRKSVRMCFALVRRATCPRRAR